MNISRLIVFLGFLFGGLGSLHAQIASYDFDSNTEDQIGGYHATVFGSPTFENGEYISFTPGEYLSLPIEVSQAIDISESWQFQFRFKVEGDWRETEDEEAQVIIASKVFDQRVGGFSITAQEWGGQLQLITTFGDGIVYEPGGCASCCTTCTQSEGKLDWVIDIDSGIWYEVKLKFIFDSDRPYIQYEVNGTISTSYFDLEDPRADPEGFRQTINKQQIWVGADQENNSFIHEPDRSRMNLQIDHLSFWSPVPPGEPTKVGAVLQALVEDMNLKYNSTTTNTGGAGGDGSDGTGGGSTDNGFTEAQIDSLRQVFVQYWDDQAYAENKEVIWDYINTYAEYHEPIFNAWVNTEAPQDFTPMEAIQYIMEQWILDNQYGPETVSEMGGLKFEDHELFPGKVSNSAPRVTNQKFTINGDYQTNPGFYINGQEQVIRASGYYVPPGELVTLTIPDEVIDKGLSMFVGAHNANLGVTWSQFRRFPRIMTIYQLDSKTITVSNPFGGGIYIKIPDGSNYGPLEFEVSGAVKAPYYSDVEGFSHSLEEFNAELANQYVPFVDIESRNMMATITSGMASTIEDMDSVFSIWNSSFDGVNIALGRPVERFRAEYFLIDRQNHYAGTATPASYPMPLEDYATPYGAEVTMPIEVESGQDWYRDPRQNFYMILLHEQGHLHNMPTLLHEVESNVNILSTAALSHTFGESVDSAFVYSIDQRLNLDQAAMDWVLLDNFYLGNRIGYIVETQQYNELEQRYQSRGFAKYVDIANLFGWEALGKTFKPFYERKTADPSWSPYNLLDDEYIETASTELGFNMAPHFEFWGIIPSEELVERLSDMPTSEEIKDRIIHFRSLVPKNNDEFQELYDVMASKLSWFSLTPYDQWKTTYDEARAQLIIDRIDEILNKYYEIDGFDYNQNPAIVGLTDALYTTINTPLTIELGDLIVQDPDNAYPADFTMSIADGDNYSVNGTTITPHTDFSGELSVPITVNDGLEDSEPYLATINVIPENDRPVITGVVNALATPEDVQLVLELDAFVVEDNDHNYPDDFDLIVSGGDNYSVSGTTITPDLNYFGTISVPVKVSDGVQESQEFIAEVTVTEVNDPPVVVGPSRLINFNEDESQFLWIDEFIVTDVDHEPGEYSIEILGGEHYSVEDNTITPEKDFFGQLTLTVVANDGIDESDPFEFIIEVNPVNDKPVINGVVTSLATEIDQEIELKVSDFDITDPDNTYPDDFTLTVLEGTNYSVSATTVIPNPSFTGELLVAVIVNDGDLDSDPTTVTINVVPPNDDPVITGQEALNTDEDTSITIELTDLTVEDSDHSYPDDFTLRLFAGEHYTLSGAGDPIITPELNFFGQLMVPVTVNDGVEESEQFILIIDVIPVNDKPVITDQRAELLATEDTPFDLSLSDFEVEDPDNTYPDDFVLSIQSGANYSVDGLTVTPAQDFDGTLSISVTVNDGTDVSDPFMAEVPVTAVNDQPVINGLVEPLTTEVDVPVELSLGNFVIEDPDNESKDFTLAIFEGENYTSSGSTVIPASGFIGDLSIPITVNDGALDSEPFLATVEVAEVLGIDNGFVKRHFSVTPNPTTDQVSIVKDQEILYYHFSLLSLKGDLIYTGKSVTKEIEIIDLRKLSNGFYLLQITSPDGVGTFKVMKR